MKKSNLHILALPGDPIIDGKATVLLIIEISRCPKGKAVPAAKHFFSLLAKNHYAVEGILPRHNTVFRLEGLS